MQSASEKQSEPVTKSVAGKVASIGNADTTFALQPEGNDKQVMNFVVGKDTQVKGHVTTGTVVTVEYRPTDDGRNVALSVTVRS
jgi:translation initiation factor IF-1